MASEASKTEVGDLQEEREEQARSENPAGDKESGGEQIVKSMQRNVAAQRDWKCGTNVRRESGLERAERVNEKPKKAKGGDANRDGKNMAQSAAKGRPEWCGRVAQSIEASV